MAHSGSFSKKMAEMTQSLVNDKIVWVKNDSEMIRKVLNKACGREYCIFFLCCVVSLQI